MMSGFPSVHHYFLCFAIKWKTIGSDMHCWYCGKVVHEFVEIGGFIYILILQGHGQKNVGIFTLVINVSFIKWPCYLSLTYMVLRCMYTQNDVLVQVHEISNVVLDKTINIEQIHRKLNINNLFSTGLLGRWE